MKLSFSTRGWKGYTFSEFCDAAKDMGFSGLELHNLRDEAFRGDGNVCDPVMANIFTRRLSDMGLSIPCVDSVCNIADAAMLEQNITEINECVRVAHNLSIPYVRVRALTPEGDGAEEENTVFNCLSAVIGGAEKQNVCLLIETVGLYADTARLAEMLSRFASDSLGALWDMHHPYRVCGEAPWTTVKNLGAFIRQVHLKDSEEQNGEVRYCLIGEGTLPVEEMMSALYSINYNGFVSLEWDPDWDEIHDMEIIFLHFVNYMSRFGSSSRKPKPLYSNRAGTGKFVWKKDTLIDCTFSEVLDRQVEEFPDQLAFKYTTLDYTRTYSEFRDDVDTFARSLISMGVKAGTHVAVWATNVPQWYIAFWATTKIGAVLVTMNTAYKVHEAEYLLRQSDTHTLIMIESALDSNYAAIMKELCPELETQRPGEPLHARRLPFLRNIITVGYRQPGCLTWEEAIARADSVPVEEVYRMAAAVDSHDVCNMQYTSGTTGFPKGVMLTHYNVVNNGKYIGDTMDLSTADRMMIQVPMFHCFGMVLSMTSSMTHGATLLPLPYFSAKSSLACVHQERITCFNGVPTMFIAMLRHEDFEKTDFSYIRTGIMAGSNCPPSLMREAAEKMGMTEITSVYGQTEASPGCTMGRWEAGLDARVETVGSAFPEVECKIIDPDTGDEVPVGQNGEFVARGYNVMKGYYKMPKETAEAIDADGWLHTGDLACKDENGNYRITGRLKDMIIRGGENIYPREIEEFLYTNPKVKDVQVIGVPDEQYGEEIMASIILQEGAAATEQEIKEFVASHMARHKVPRYVDFVKAFPMNAAGKILKYKMREEAAEKYGLKKK